MKKRLDIIFFSICFLTALLAETYCIQVLKGDLFSVIGIGVVVLITGYLLMDSVRSKLVKGNEYLKYYLGQIYSEEKEKWNERYSELLNMQKATYTATKKNTAILSEQLEKVVIRLEALESSNTKSLQRLIELQMKALEGQKNGLNLELNYNKENTKQLMKVLREEGNRFELKEELAKILTSLEENNSILREHTTHFGTSRNEFDSEIGASTETGFVHDFFVDSEENLTEAFYKEFDTSDRIDTEVQEDNASENSWTRPSWESTAQIVEEVEKESYLLGDKVNTVNDIGTFVETDIVADTEVSTMTDTETFAEIDTEIFAVTDKVETVMAEYETDILERDAKITEDLLNALLSESETVEEQKAAIVAPAVVPLYDDPNKALTADEIAALFASFGQ